MNNASRRFWIAVVPLVALAGACAPKIDQAAKADIDGRMAALKPGAEAHGAPTAPEPMAPKIGQWTTHKMADDKNQPSFMTYKIVGEEGGAFWVEIVNDTYYGKTIQKMLIEFGDRKNPSTMKIKALKTKDRDGKVTEMDAQMLSFMHGIWDPMLKNLVINWTGLPQEDATVPAGVFSACYKGKSEVSFGPIKASSTSWSHPAVPLNGVVRSQGIDKPFTMELCAYGESGAATEM